MSHSHFQLVAPDQIQAIDHRQRMVLTYFGDTHAIAELSRVLAEEAANIEMISSQTHHGARSFEMIVNIFGVESVDCLKSRMMAKNRELNVDLAVQNMVAHRKNKRMMGIPLDQVVAIGDGANDSLMLTQAGLGIAYNAKKGLDRVANAALSQESFTHIFHLLGITQEDIEEAMSCKTD